MPALFCALVLLAAPAEPPRPKLGVLLVFDQLGSQELDRLTPFFGAGGFGGLTGAGAAWYDADYTYAGTETGPGHATLATGANPAVHGIVGNEWFEHGAKVFVVDDPDMQVLSGKPGDGRGPKHLLVGTLADAMKVQSAGAAKVITLSLKDRGAILTAGRTADLALWYESGLGAFTSSRAYVEAVPAWASSKGAELIKRSLDTGKWSPLPIPEALASLVGPDDAPGESKLETFTTSFPHDLTSITDEAARRRAYRVVPQSMDDLFALGLAAIDAEKLGADAQPDLLVISISTTDYVGHIYGPYSREYVDIVRRADLAVRRFVAELQKKVGKTGFVLAVSSDHGAAALPEQAAAAHMTGGRILTDVLEKQLAEAATAASDKKKRVLGVVPPHVFVDTTELSQAARDKLLDALQAVLEKTEGISRVYRAPLVMSDPFAGFLAQSSYPGREGELMIISRPRYIFSETRYPSGTNHGTPNLYDRRVPFFLLGPGVRGGRYAAPVDPRDVAVSLAFLLHVQAPESAQGHAVPAIP